MPINLPTYEQQQQTITLLQELGVDVDTLLAGRVVKNVQRGTATLTTNTTVNISTVNVNKSLLVFSYKTSSNGVNNIPAGKISTSTQLIFEVGQAATNPSTVEWQVIEFY